MCEYMCLNAPHRLETPCLSLSEISVFKNNIENSLLSRYQEFRHVSYIIEWGKFRLFLYILFVPLPYLYPEI